jgi:acyl-CoA synthetase (AMP-forming)/AMP-acid ligase II
MDTAMLTLDQLAPRAAARYADATFLQSWSSTRGLGARLSFAEFAHAERRGRAALAALGVGRGTRVAFLTHACAESLALSLAAASLGGVAVNLNWRQPESTLTTLLDGMRCEALVATAGLAAAARRVRAVCEAHQPRWLVLAGDQEQPVAADAWERLFTVGSAGDDSGDDGGGGDSGGGGAPSPDDVALVMFTSGTSALPKAVPLTHAGLLWSCAAKAAAEEEQIGFAARGAAHRGTLAFLPTFHVIGFTNNFLRGARESNPSAARRAELGATGLCCSHSALV